MQLDDYGYPPPPDTRWKLRKKGIRASKTVLSACLYVCMCIVGAILRLSRAGRQLPALSPRSVQPHRLLVIRLDLIGDLVLSMTVVRALKRTYPGVEIDLLALPSSAPIISDDPDLTQVIPYDPNIWRRPKAFFQARNWRNTFQIVRRLRSRHYDIAVSVFGNWAAMLAVVSGAKRRVGFGRESYPGFMTDSVPGGHWGSGERLHEVDYCLKLARAAGVAVSDEDRVPHLYVSQKTRSELDSLLDNLGIKRDRPLIACHVASNNGQSKRWPLLYWTRLLDRLVSEWGAQVVLTGAPGDLPLVERILERMEQKAFNLVGKTSLSQLAALFQRADVMISGDSGPMHIADALDTPLIAIHGPTDPAQFGPVGPAATVLKSGIWCSPCYNVKGPADCRFYTTQCMKNITPAQVFGVVEAKLREKYPQPVHLEVGE